MKEISILLVDDHVLIRDGLKKILGMEPSIEIVGEAANGQEAVEMAEKLKPRIILMDINMPVMSGIEATKIIKKHSPDIDIVALTIHDDEEYVYELINSGISGYILKDISVDDLISTIDKVAGGETVFHPNITKKILGEFQRITKVEKSLPRLTHREIEVLDHVTRGENNRQIAEKLYISEKTVKNHLTNIFKKIQVEDRTQAALYAIKNKIITL